MLNRPVALVSNHMLESLEDLNRRLETDGQCWEAVLTGRLSHHRPGQIRWHEPIPGRLKPETRFRLLTSLFRLTPLSRSGLDRGFR